MNINEARTQWEKAAPGWAKWENVFSEGVGEVTEAMMEMAGMKTGSHVLDLASGAGSQTLIAAKRVGPTGYVVANDISATMLDHVSKNAAAKGFSNVSTLLGAVQELDIKPETFDAAICRFGLMLFADPGKVLFNILQALKPKGKIGIVVFSSPEANQFLSRTMQILLQHAGKKPPAGGPGLFSLGAEDTLKNLFKSGGYVNVEIRKQSITFKLPHAAETLTMMQEAFGAYRAVIADSPVEVQQAAWAEVLEYLKTLEAGQGMEAPAEVLIGSAQKPAK